MRRHRRQPGGRRRPDTTLRVSPSRRGSAPGPMAVDGRDSTEVGVECGPPHDRVRPRRAPPRPASGETRLEVDLAGHRVEPRGGDGLGHRHRGRGPPGRAPGPAPSGSGCPPAAPPTRHGPSSSCMTRGVIIEPIRSPGPARREAAPPPPSWSSGACRNSVSQTPDDRPRLVVTAHSVAVRVGRRDARGVAAPRVATAAPRPGLRAVSTSSPPRSSDGQHAQQVVEVVAAGLHRTAAQLHLARGASPIGLVGARSRRLEAAGSPSVDQQRLGDPPV